MTRLYDKVAQQLNLNKDDVKEAYGLYWKFIKETIATIPVKTVKNKEEFKKLKTYFNLSDLGKIYLYYNENKQKGYERYIQGKRSKSTVESCTVNS